MTSRRVRKHANPFHVRTRLGVLDRLAIFGREVPLEVDLGPGAAGFLLARARNHPERDFVGLEVRRLVVEAAVARCAEEGIENVRVLYASAHENIVLAPGAVACYHVHFPDPCFKKRHWKRRIVQPRLVRAMAEGLAIGGTIYAQSDLLPLAEEMYFFLESEGALHALTPPSLCVPSPVPERTEWERHHEARGEPVHRMLFEKVREPSGPVPDLAFREVRPVREAAREPALG